MIRTSLLRTSLFWAPALYLALSLSPLGSASADGDANSGQLPATISVSPPAGWSHLPGLSKRVAQGLSETEFFGEGEAFESGVMAYGRASRGSLYVSWVSSSRTHPTPEQSLRLAFDELHEEPFLANAGAGSIQEVEYRERVFDGVAEMRFEWAHLENETVNVVRALGWKDKDARVHLAISECLLLSDSVAETRPLCTAALDSFALTAAATHETLASLPEPNAQVRRAPKDYEVPKLKTNEVLEGPSLGAPPSQMGEVLYQGPPPVKEDSNNRVIIAIGALLLAVAFFLTTRSRPGDEPESPSETEDEA